MNKHIILLVDASGSMCGAQDETREAISKIIKDTDKDTHLKIILFDTGEYKILCDNLAAKIPNQLGYLYEALGGTPITDAVYKSIQDIVADVELENLNQDHKFIIFTDGEENSSHYVKSSELGTAIEHFTENFNWDFNFIGPKSCEIGIKRYADQIKIKSEKVNLYANISEGLNQMVEISK